MLGSSRGDARYIGTIHTPSRRLLDSVRAGRGLDCIDLLSVASSVRSVDFRPRLCPIG